MNQASIPIISLFCGAGGLDLGFRQAGFETVLAADADPAAIQSFGANFPPGVALCANLAKLSASDLVAKLGGRLSAEPRGIIGGPPCQGFSRGNVSPTSSDLRNRLPYRFAKLVEEFQQLYPIDFFVFENVPGLLGKKHSLRWSAIQRRFAALGFRLFYTSMDASKFLTPQRRQRLILIGIHRRLNIPSFRFPPGRAHKRTVRSTIGHLPEPWIFERQAGASRPSQNPFHPNHWTMKPKSYRFTSGEFNRWRSFRILGWDTVSPTVAYGNREVHIHPDGHRRLSVLEAMLLQGFPMKYRIIGNLSEQFSQVSNAVPPPLANAVARTLREALMHAIPAAGEIT